MKLNEKSAYYMIVSGTHPMQDEYTNRVFTSKLEDALYLKEYKIVKLGNGHDNISFLAYKENAEDNNNELRYDAIELMDSFYQDSVIVKYYNESKVKRILKDGSERTVGLSNYNGDTDNSYFNEGFSFSFVDQEEFFIPKKSSDIKVGMIVEIKNNKNQWTPKEVVNPEKEWNKMYHLLVKYGRIRCLKD
ncbi:MAG: hypothetical protein SLAVMIC_00778 [uncultured marine phage]|uniref:Uncharacterized protein n=1 Tax=uncultured marine phage TaxID=707152 RepID=A0A8D9FQI2_9VIRU|nr:MAG: hypothetical protein SLAVMIC_00778 [uncultured marine phage]